jgi:hypothetical protein
MTAGYDFGQLYGQADMSTGIRIPEAAYDAVCVKSEWGRTKDGSKGQWTVDTTITTGQYAGTKLVNTITISPVKNDGTENSKGIGIMFRHLHAFGVPVPPPLGERGFWELGWREEQVAQFMVGKPVTIVTKDDEYEGVTKSKIRDYQPAKPGAPLQPQVQQPQQAQNGYGQANGYGAQAVNAGPAYQQQQTAPQPWQQAVQGGPGYPQQVQGAPAWAQPAQPGQGGYGEFTPQGQSVQPGYGQAPQGGPGGGYNTAPGATGGPGYPPQSPYGQPNADWNPAAQGYGAPATGALAQGAPYQQGAPSPSDQGQPAMPPWAQQAPPQQQGMQPGPVQPQDPGAAPPPPWAQ